MTSFESLSPQRKALKVNKDDHFYGTFAEIGAGQEVARYFFQAGLASKTIAKTMSAYDKTFSDAIYGKGSRFVSEARLEKMLDHEMSLLQERLTECAEDKAFFAFASTVATSSHSHKSTSHCWMGVRFQSRPGGPINEIKLHVQMLDRMRLQQQEAVGILGVNLIHAAFFKRDNINEFVPHLKDIIGSDRIEINFLHVSGDDLIYIDNRLLSLELVKENLASAVMFNPKGQPVAPDEVLYKTPVLAVRGTFRPVTNTNVQILEQGLEQMKRLEHGCEKKPLPLFEITMSQLQSETGHINQKDFLDRVDTLCCLGHHVLISNYPLFSQLKNYLRNASDAPLAMVIGASLLSKLVSREFYEDMGGIMTAFGQLFDDHTKMYVFPYKTQKSCMTAATFKPEKELKHLYKYLCESNYIVDLGGCDDILSSVHSEDVRVMLENNDPEWEKLVPKPVCKLIKDKNLFGFKGE